MTPASLCLLLALQAAPPEPLGAAELFELERLHLRAVRVERTARLAAGFLEAGEEPRSRVLDYVEQAREPGERPGRRPSLAELARLQRALEGTAPEELDADPLVSFVDAIDLRAIPGAFQSDGREGRGDPLEVRVQALWPPRFQGRLRLTLEWRAPGGASSPARSEPFDARRFAAPGFPMYVRAPLGEPGPWALVPVVEVGERRLEGYPVPVEGVRDLDLRRSLLDPAPSTWKGAEPPLLGLLLYGMRFANGSPPSTWLDLSAGLDVTGTRLVPGGPFPETLRPYVLEPDAHASPRARLVFLAPEQEGAASLEATSLGALGAALADEGVWAAFLELPPSERSGFLEALRALAEEPGPLVLVARGDAVASLHLVAALGMSFVDGIVLASPLPPGPSLPEVPVLWIREPPRVADGNPKAARRDLPGRVSQVVDARPDWLLDPDLARLVLDWLVSSGLAPPAGSR